MDAVYRERSTGCRSSVPCSTEKACLNTQNDPRAAQLLSRALFGKFLPEPALYQNSTQKNAHTNKAEIQKPRDDAPDPPSHIKKRATRDERAPPTIGEMRGGVWGFETTTNGQQAGDSRCFS